MMGKEPIRVLQIIGRMDRGGIETMIMNLYRNIDRDKVQFDFLAHYGREAAYNDEIRAMGGRIYEMPAYIIGAFFNIFLRSRNSSKNTRNIKSSMAT